MGIRETRLYEKALTQRWNIPPQMREEIIESLLRVLRDATASPREKTSAAKALMAADKLNIEQEKIQQNDEHHGDRLDMERLHRIAGVAKQLGFDAIAQRAIEAGSGGGAVDANPE